MSVLDYVRHHLWPCTLLITVISLPGPLAAAAPTSARPVVHGLWVWNAASILDSPAESLTRTHTERYALRSDQRARGTLLRQRRDRLVTASPAQAAELLRGQWRPAWA
jgi:hypothetical protein